MNILFFIHHLGNGGAERVTSVLANELAERGNKVTIGVYEHNENGYDLNSKVHVQRIYMPTGRFRRFRKYLKIRSVIKGNQPDVIIAVMPYNFVAAYISSFGLGIPVIVSDHANFTWNLNRTLKFIRHRVYALADKVTVLSHNDEKYMEKKLHNMKVMYNPLSFPRLTESTERMKNILACGRVSIWDVKGFDLLIKMWGNLAPKYPDWTLDIAGDGSEADFNHLKEIAKESNVLDRINFLGFCRNIKDVMAHSSIFALSSRAEGFPCSLLEAMSQGCAPVSFSIHGIISEIIDNNNDGFIVTDNDLDTFENRLSFLIENQECRQSMSNKAIASMERFEVSTIVDEWETFLNEIIAK